MKARGGFIKIQKQRVGETYAIRRLCMHGHSFALFVQPAHDSDPPVSRDEIVRGFFHRINRILFRKNQIFDIDTIFYSPYYVKKSLKNRTF